MRPGIVCHTMSSIDGPLLSDRWSRPRVDVSADRLFAHYDEVAARFAADGHPIDVERLDGGMVWLRYGVEAI